MNFKIGVRGHDMLSKSEPSSFFKAIKEEGFSRVQLVFPKAFATYSYDDVFVSEVKAELDKNEITVSMLGAYFNPVHSDKEVVRKGIENFKNNLRIAKLFGNAPVGSETGSYNDSPWTYVPKNHTEEGYQETLSVFKGLVEYAESLGSFITVEPAFNHVIYSSEVLKRFVSDLDSPNVFVTIDLYNLLSLENCMRHKELFHEALSTFGNKIKILHLKDFVKKNNEIIQVAPFRGEFDYPYMISEIKQYCPDATMIFEGVKKDEIAMSLSALQTCIQHC